MARGWRSRKSKGRTPPINQEKNLLKTATKKILRWESGSTGVRCQDAMAVEEPLEIRVDTHSVCVTMRTPGHDEELAAGFLLTEGMIRSQSDIRQIKNHPRNRSENVVDVFLAPDVTVDFSQLTRHVFASSSCGLCGKATIEAVHQHFKPLRRQMTVRAETLLSLPGKMRLQQDTFERTGGLHAAAIFSADGTLVVLREDVGRHNAVDKVLGYGLREGLIPFAEHVLMVSGRTSFEIVQKALAGRIPVVCSVSAPSSLAVDFARASGQTLVGFLRENRMNVYAGAPRIRF
jgi:FdhD protein